MFARLRLTIIEIDITDDIDGADPARPKTTQPKPDDYEYWNDELQDMLDDYD